MLIAEAGGVYPGSCILEKFISGDSFLVIRGKCYCTDDGPVFRHSEWRTM